MAGTRSQFGARPDCPTHSVKDAGGGAGRGNDTSLFSRQGCPAFEHFDSGHKVLFHVDEGPFAQNR